MVYIKRAGGSVSGSIEVDSINVDPSLTGTAAAPSLSFGDGNTGFYEVLDNTLRFAGETIDTLEFKAAYLQGLRAANGPRLNLTAASAGDVIYTFVGDTDTGTTRPAADQYGITVGGVPAITYIENVGVLQLQQITAGITADTGSSQGDGPLTSSVNQISVCANAGDAVTLPTAVAGYLVEIYNDGANACDVFPASGDNAGGGVDTAVSLAAGANITYRAIDTTNWIART